jgi:hypothetical protein
MSQENVEVVRRYYEAVQRAFRAYWEDPRSVADSLQAGDVPPVAVEMIRCLNPDAEWKTALTGITYRGYSELAGGFDQTARPPRLTASRSRPLLTLEATRSLRW